MFTGGIAPLVVSPGDVLSSIDTEGLSPHATLEQIDSEEKVSKVQETENFGFENINTVWVDESSPEMGRELKKMLGADARVYVGPTPLASEPPSSVVFCSNGEDVASNIGRLRALTPDASILALSSGSDPYLARETILAGGHGFIHLGMQRAQVFRALSATSKSETLVPKALLVAFLEEKLSREHVTVLTSHQREFLELIIASGIFEEEIVVPRKLLEAFLR
jgi:hypothetical protein